MASELAAPHGWRPWTWVGVAAGSASVFVAFYIAHVLGLASGPDLTAPSRTGSSGLLLHILGAIEGELPLVLVMCFVWTALIRRSGRERLLLVVGVYLSGLELRPLIADALHTGGHLVGSAYRYPNITAFYATIVYGGLVFAIDRSAIPVGPRRVFGITAFCGMIAGWTFPIWAGYARVPDILGSIAFAATLFALGIALAQFAKVDLVDREELDVEN